MLEPQMTSEDMLCDLEQSLGKLRSQWTKADWQRVAEMLSHLVARALKVAGEALDTARQMQAPHHEQLSRGLASARPGGQSFAFPSLAASARPAESTGHAAGESLQMHFDDANRQLRALLADPFGREAYVRLARDKSPAARLLMSKRQGPLPAKKGALAAKSLIPGVPPPRGKPGRPRKNVDPEVARWLRLFAAHSERTGLPIKITPWVRVVFQKLDVDVTSRKGQRDVEQFARAMLEERKRRKRLSGKKSS